MAIETEETSGDVLDAELAELLNVETFDPPEEFRKTDLIACGP